MRQSEMRYPIVSCQMHVSFRKNKNLKILNIPAVPNHFRRKVSGTAGMLKVMALGWGKVCGTAGKLKKLKMLKFWGELWGELWGSWG